MKRKDFNTLFAATLIAFCLVLVGCGPSEESARTELAPETLHWVTWDTGSKGEAQLVKQFQEEFPQIDFDRSGMSMSVDMHLDDTPRPDIVNMDVGWGFAQVAGKGKLADLTELWVESGLAEHVPAALQAVSAFEDRQYYIPIGVGWTAIYYNKQIFADYNLTPPQTWDEFLVICDTLQLNGEVPLAIAGAEPWGIHGWFEYLNLRMNGAQFHRDLLAGKERYDDPRVREVMTLWQSLFANGYFIEEADRVSSIASMTSIIRSDNGLLEGDRAVMALANTYSYENMPEPFQAEVDFFRFPIIDPAIPMAEVVEPFGYSVPMGADHLPGTIAFLKYLSSSRAQLLAAQLPIYFSITSAPARGDMDTEALSAANRNALTLFNEADEMVIALGYGVPDKLRFALDTWLRAFVSKPEEIDTFIFKLEEIRQQLVDQGVLLTE